MALVNLLWQLLLITILFICLSMVIVGGLWVLRVAIRWWLDVDYVEELKRWAKKQ